jgi:uncharacterized protein (DUF433 family)
MEKFIEQMPDKASGRPVMFGTRITPDGIVDSFEQGGRDANIDADWSFLDQVPK